jgi:pseudouridine-5'-phosphate glycosidase
MNLFIAPAVAEAIQSKKPVVALESTVITHGLPFPDNRKTALAMESAVRAAGAVPATIAVLRGVITIGLTEAEIDRLAQLPYNTVRKCSRRDFPIAVGLGEDAATTVAGTMIAAEMAGIRFFATGGIGGVHRGHPFDVSADLMELGRTSVAVICSGAKSILDLPLTLEVLETQGVPIVGLATATLPSFYSRDSGLALDVQVETVEEAARVAQASFALNLGHGVLIAVPVPAEHAMPSAKAEVAITQALAEADQAGVHGKAVTPFLLKRVSELTGGESRTANLALLVNNARVAGEIACAWAKLNG